MNELLAFVQSSLLLLATWIWSLWAFKLALPFRWQRSLLVGGLLFSTLPLLRLAIAPYFHQTPGMTFTLPVVEVGVISETSQAGSYTSQVGWLLYLAGTLLAVLPGIWSVTRMLGWWLRGKRQVYLQSTLVFTGSTRHGLCSFGKWIFIPGNSHELPSHLLLAHELAHVRSWHTADKLLMQILVALFWFFPPTYRLRTQLELLHELEADAATSSEYGAFAYALELSAYRLGVSHLQLVNPFFKSNHQFLTRINMLNKTMNPRHNWLVPAALSLVFVAACTQGVVSERDAQAAKSSKVYAEQQELAELNKLPAYPGGQDALMRFLSENIAYPAEAKADSAEGMVVISFVVTPEGKIKDAQVVKQVHPLLDEAALRMMTLMPDWTPGEKDGQPVAVQYHLPIRFALK